MSVEANLVYRRTDRGLREIYEKTHQFTQSERLILILLDGRLNVAGLQTRMPSLTRERLVRSLRKLTSAGLIELASGPSAHADAVGQGSGTRQDLKPEVVAEFLAQSDLDPVTVVGSDVDIELASRSSHGRSAVSHDTLTLQEIETFRRDPVGPVDDSVYTRLMSSRAGPMAVDTVASDFAITSVNVPDRLDLQEVRAREDEDYVRPRALSFDRYLFSVWLSRLVWAGVLGGLVFAGYRAVEPVRERVSPDRIAQSLSAASGQSVAVADTLFRVTPTPRLVLLGVDVPGQFRLDEVSLRINWEEAWRGLQVGQIAWGEAVVSGQAISLAQALALLQFLGKGSGAIPDSITTIRFEGVSFSDAALLPGRYDALWRRGSDGHFGPVLLTSAGGDESFRLRIVPAEATVGATASGRIATFQLDARDFQLPFGPRTRWGDVSANGSFESERVVINGYLLTGLYGAVQGVANVTHDKEWVLDGTALANNIDMEAMLLALNGKSKSDGSGDVTRVALQGTATMELRIAGSGETLRDSLANGSISGPVQVRWGTLNGINLGFAATQGAASGGFGGGITRFTNLSAQVDAGTKGIRLREISGNAGAMTTHGEIVVGDDLALNGALRVELGVTQIHAPLTVRVRGTALAPRFGG